MKQLASLLPDMNGPVGLTTLCTSAVTLLGAGSTHVLLLMYDVIPITSTRVAGVALTYAAGSYLLWLGHCRSLIQPKPKPPARRGRR